MTNDLLRRGFRTSSSATKTKQRSARFNDESNFNPIRNSECALVSFSVPHATYGFDHTFSLDYDPLPSVSILREKMCGPGQVRIFSKLLLLFPPSPSMSAVI